MIFYKIVDFDGLNKVVFKNITNESAATYEAMRGEWKLIVENLDIAMTYVEQRGGVPVPEIEPFIIKDSYYAAGYAMNILRKRWPEAEPVIAQDPHDAAIYAATFFQKEGRWPEGEPAILTSLSDTWYYLCRVINRDCKVFSPGKWPEGEDLIAQDSQLACEFALKTCKRWPKGEPAILKNRHCADKYAKNYNLIHMDGAFMRLVR